MKEQKREERLSEAEFKRLFGVKKDTFGQMLGVLEKEYERMHKSGGSPPKLSVRDKLRVALQYLREYRTMEHIGFDWGVAKSTVSEAIKWVEDTLVKDGTFSLPGRRSLAGSASGIRYVIVDVTESPVERPKKNSADTTPERKSVTP
jgi:hypothetical protein